MREDTMRRALLIVAAFCWAASLTVSWMIIDKVIDTLKHPGISLLVFMTQGLAITLTIVWAQFRNRRVMVETMRAGLQLAEEKRKMDEHETQHS